VSGLSRSLTRITDAWAFEIARGEHDTLYDETLTTAAPSGG
jgi:hypothetical protein